MQFPGAGVKLQEIGLFLAIGGGGGSKIACYSKRVSDSVFKRMLNH